MISAFTPIEKVNDSNMKRMVTGKNRNGEFLRYFIWFEMKIRHIIFIGF